MVKQIIKEAMEKNPIGLKEAVEAELVENTYNLLLKQKERIVWMERNSKNLSSAVK